MNDPHGLLVTGEELATEAELSKLLRISRAAMRPFLQGAHGEIRYVHYPCNPRRYAVADARRAVVPCMPEIEARQRLAAERQASEVAAAGTRRQARADGHAAHVASSLTPPSARGDRRDAVGAIPEEPETIVRRRS